MSKQDKRALYSHGIVPSEDKDLVGDDLSGLARALRELGLASELATTQMRIMARAIRPDPTPGTVFMDTFTGTLSVGDGSKWMAMSTAWKPVTNDDIRAFITKARAAPIIPKLEAGSFRFELTDEIKDFQGP